MESANGDITRRRGILAPHAKIPDPLIGRSGTKRRVSKELAAGIASGPKLLQQVGHADARRPLVEVEGAAKQLKQRVEQPWRPSRGPHRAWCARWGGCRGVVTRVVCRLHRAKPRERFTRTKPGLHNPREMRSELDADQSKRLTEQVP